MQKLKKTCLFPAGNIKSNSMLKLAIFYICLSGNQGKEEDDNVFVVHQLRRCTSTI
jgi:hypothetical protein